MACWSSVVVVLGLRAMVRLLSGVYVVLPHYYNIARESW